MEYATTYRNTALLLPGLAALLFGWFGAIALMLLRLEPAAVMDWFLWSALAVVVTMAALVLASLRAHRWRIEDDALAIEERPRVPFTGVSRHRRLPFAEIAGIERRDNIRDRYLDVSDRAGRRYRMPQAMIAQEGGRFPVGVFDPANDLAGFEQALRTAATAHGIDLPRTAPALGFFATWPGLAFLGVAMLLCCALAGTLVWAWIDGMEHRTGRGAGDAAALVLALPLLVGWAIRSGWRQRRRVLAPSAPAP